MAPPDPGGPGDVHLETTGVGDEALTAVHRPDVVGRCGSAQRPQLGPLLEHQVTAGRVAQVSRIARQERSQSSGSGRYRRIDGPGAVGRRVTG
jgi:hypothetical protein